MVPFDLVDRRPEIGERVFVADGLFLEIKPTRGHSGIVEKIVGNTYVIRLEVEDQYKHHFRSVTTSEIVSILSLGSYNEEDIKNAKKNR